MRQRQLVRQDLRIYHSSYGGGGNRGLRLCSRAAHRYGHRRSTGTQWELRVSYHLPQFATFPSPLSITLMIAYLFPDVNKLCSYITRAYVITPAWRTLN